MNLQQYKVLFIVVSAVLALLVASPALQRALVYPQTEYFTEIWLLGPDHVAEDYPHNITQSSNYTVFIGISNHLGSCAYYSLQVKFRNQSQSAPDNFNRTSSNMPPLYNISAFVADKESWELPVTFAFDYSFRNITRTVYSNITVTDSEGNATIEERAENVTLLQVVFEGLKFNGVRLDLDGYASDLNSQTNEYFGNLVFELWMFNGSKGDFEYHERYVDLKLNMTSTGMGGDFAR